VRVNAAWQEKLREQAWLQARAEVFHQTGVRIPLPQFPESMERQQSAEEVALTRQISRQLREIGALAAEIEADKAAASPAAAPGVEQKAPDPAAGKYGPAPAEIGNAPLTNREIKFGIRRLVDAQVDRKAVEDLRTRAESGGLSQWEFANMVIDLLEAKEVA